MNCKRCGKSVCVEEAAACRGYCLGCYVTARNLELDALRAFWEAFAGRLGLKRRKGGESDR